MKSICIAYHDVYETVPVSGIPQTATMYHISKATFAGHLHAIKTSGRRVVTLGDFLSGGHDNSVVITFDDGWKGAFEIALPLLEAAGLKATFFVTRDFVGRKGFCNRDMIIEAAKVGMEIGVHGTTHRMMSSCSHAEIAWEFAACKTFLESLLGKPVEFASLPGGDWNNTIAFCAKEAGLRCLYTSRPGINNARTSLFNLRRVAIRATTQDKDVFRYCHFNINRELVRWTLFQIPRWLFGMKNYARFRKWLMEKRGDSSVELFKP